MKLAHRAFECLCIASLGAAATTLFLLSIPLIPYFAWKWWREEQAGKREIERQIRLSRGGYYDHS